MMFLCTIPCFVATACLAVLTAGCTVQSPLQPVRSTDVTVPGPAATAAKFGSAPPPFVFPDGCCYYQGGVVRTVVSPAATPRAGRDNFYAITDGVPGQKGVVGVAPGDSGYHGGHWKFHSVTFNVAPYLITSEAAILAAAAAGDVTVTPVPENDFRCPIQP